MPLFFSRARKSARPILQVLTRRLSGDHIVMRALQLLTAEIEVIDIRDYADGSFRHIDEAPYGGGAGMVLRCEPVLSALASVRIPREYDDRLNTLGRSLLTKAGCPVGAN